MLEKFIYALVFLIPLYLIKIKIFGLPTNFWEIIFGLIFIVWVWQRWGKIEVNNFYNNYKKYIFCAGLIFAGFLLSLFYNYATYYIIDYIHSFGIIISWFLVPIIFMLMAADIIPREKLKNIFWAYYLSAFFVAFIALFYLIFGKMTFDGRLAAIFNSPNYLAMYLAPAIIIGLAGKSKNIFLAISLMVILVVFYFTYSYAAWAALIMALSIVFLIKNKVSFKKVIIIAGIIVLLALSQIRNNKFNDLMNFDERSSLASRVMIWKSVGKIISNNAIFGIGAGNFQNKYLKYQKYFPPYLEWAVPHPHNLYLAFWLYSGIIGLLGFLALIFFYLQDIFREIKNGHKMSIIYVSLAIMLYILIHGLVDTTYFKNDPAIVFWLCFLVLKKL